MCLRHCGGGVVYGFRWGENAEVGISGRENRSWEVLVRGFKSVGLAQLTIYSSCSLLGLTLASASCVCRCDMSPEWQAERLCDIGMKSSRQTIR